jgi:hypothetical protein
MKAAQPVGILQLVASLIDAKLGRCFFCIRKSFNAALGAWVILVGINQFPLFHDYPFLTNIAWVVAVATTLLWLAHLIASATRSTSNIPSKETSTHTAETLSRRALLPLFAKSFAVVALWSALPRIALADACSKKCDDGTTASITCDTPPKTACACYCTSSANCTCHYP